LAQAQSACQHGIELNAGSPIPYNNLAWALIVRGEQLERAIDLLQIGLRLCHSNEQRSMCNSTLSLAYLKQGEIEPALARAQTALQQTGREHRPRLAELHYGLGLIQQAAGMIQEARSSFEQVSKLDPHGRYVEKARRSLMELGYL
jgi:tetratricopeptide (TPR) repeat protein